MIDYRKLGASFEQIFARKPRLFRAPGRVNLIGEHTDYNDGFVMPMAIERDVGIAACPRQDRVLRVRSLNFKETVEIDLDRPGTPRRGRWTDYVEGMARMLLERGARLGGAELAIESDVPLGAGLSSSAALEMAVGLALLGVSDQKLDGRQLALAGQAAEHQYVGTRCGIMDQYISALGRAGHALLIDCRSLEPAAIPMSIPGISVLLTDTRIKHSLASSAYNERRSECERGASLLATRLPGVKALRDVTVAEFETHADVLNEPVRRRCKHVVGENERTVRAAEALRRGDLDTMGRLMLASHASLRDDYEVSCPELDLCVDEAMKCRGVVGSRMTGGGFGGCTVSLVRDDAVEEVQRAVGAAFEKKFGRPPSFLVTRPADGAREVALS